MIKPAAPKNGFSPNFLKGLQAPTRDEGRYIVFEGRDGLGIRVSPTGKKTFVKSYRFGAKTKLWTIGDFPAYSLHEAREFLANGMDMLRRGLDPSVQSKAIKLAKVKSAQLTFGNLADEFLANHIASETTISNYRECLYNYVFQSKKAPRKDGKSYSGHKYFDWSNVPAEDITREDIKSILKSITDNGITRRANLTRTALKGVWDYAIAEELVTYYPMAAIKDPAKKTRGTRSLSISEIPVFWHGLLKIRSHKTVLALRLILLLARRETEVCGAKWSEFDLKAGEWFIPVKRELNGVMISSGLKVHESMEHLVDGLMVALPLQAIEMLKKWKKVTGNWEHVFPGEYNPSKPHNRRALSTALYRNWKSIGLSESIVPHDLRRSATTHLSRLKISPHIKARITAHSVGDSVQQTYDRYEYLDEKREAMEIWSAEVQRLIDISNITI